MIIKSLIKKCKYKRLINSLKHCGSGFKIFGSPNFIRPGSITIGDDVNINDGVILNATDSEIEIGNNVTISSNSMILAASYDVNRFFQGLKNYREHKFGKIVIRNNVWICAGAIILPNVTIADHVIVAAGSVVTKSINDSYCIVAGNPAGIIKLIDH